MDRQIAKFQLSQNVRMRHHAPQPLRKDQKRKGEGGSTKIGGSWGVRFFTELNRGLDYQLAVLLRFGLLVYKKIPHAKNLTHLSCRPIELLGCKNTKNKIK